MKPMLTGNITCISNITALSRFIYLTIALRNLKVNEEKTLTIKF
jgi:hypothetical protein